MDNETLKTFPTEEGSCRSRPWELKETARCVFCRGASCKRCSGTAYLQAISPAIEKFHCHWITDEIMAMQRPADELFDSIDLLGQFKACKITAVLNLTEPGEHPFCGFGLKPSGFPYSPERLMAVGIKHFNFAWRDMTAPSISLTQNIVRVGMAELLEGGRVAIHCHAGFGRTGIVVACLAMARTGMKSDEAVQLVRSKRPGSVQTNAQLTFIQEFEREYLFQRSIFPLIDTDLIAKNKEDNPIDMLPTVILSKPPIRRKTTFTETINRRFSFRRSSGMEKVLPATSINSQISNSTLTSTSSLRFPTPRISPSSSSLLSSSSKSSTSPLYIHLKTIDMSIIDEKLCNIEHSHPHHHELSSRQLNEQQQQQQQQPIVPTDPNYSNQSSSVLLQLILKFFRSISQSYHPLYLCAMLCGYPNDQMTQAIFNSIQNHHRSISQEPHLSFISLSQSELLELTKSLSYFRALTNQNNWKKIAEVEFINSSSTTLAKNETQPSPSSPSLSEEMNQTNKANEEMNRTDEQNSSSTEQKSPLSLSLHPLNSLLLTSLFFDWLDTRDDSLFSNTFLVSLQQQNCLSPLTASTSTMLPIMATFHYSVSPTLLPLSPENKESLNDEKPAASNQVLPAAIDHTTTPAASKNLLDLLFRKHLSRTKLSLLEDLLTLFHQFDNLSNDLYQKYSSLLFAMEMRIALSCLEETHQSLLSQYILNELDTTTNSNQDSILKKDQSGDNPPLSPPLPAEETTILSLLYDTRQMNMTTIASLLSSGVILISNPSLSSKEEQSSEGDVLPMTPAIYRSLSDLLQVINLFHTLIGMNWVSTYRSGQQLIRWRKSFVGSTVDKAEIVSVTET